MNITKTDENCYIIELSKDEMEKNKITYHKNGIYSKEEEEIFLNILKSKEKAFSFSTISVDILPGIPNGCVAVIKKRTSCSKVLFESLSIDDFIDCAKVLKERNKSAKGSLYKNENTYRLIISKDDDFLSAILCEFSTKPYFQEAEIRKTEKETKCIIKENALEILAGKRLKL